MSGQTVSTDIAAAPRGQGLALFALALGSFAIGTTEFASMGILQLFAGTLHIDLPTATHAITAYAVGVVVGAPVITLLAARLNRRTLLLCLMGLFVLGNLLSAQAQDIHLLAMARFISGLAQGAYFGAGAVVATHIVGAARAGRAFSLVVSGLTIAMIVGSPLATLLGQQLGWRHAYQAVAALGALAWVALWAWTPRSDALRGNPVLREFSALLHRQVWVMMAVAALSVASIFAVYTFIGPLVTDVAHLPAARIPVALALFGLGMALGNVLGGQLADRYAYRGLVLGFGAAVIVLVVLACGAASPWLLCAGLFGVGLTTMTAIPTLQVQLTRLAPQAPTLMGAMNMAALNVANAIGAWAGGVTIAAGLGLVSAIVAGLVLTLAGLAVFTLAVQRVPASAAIPQ
ncbi:MFS transporter [Stenotrophomonas sp. 24(2023)]|uniref:MFS transporter n=1 Tax=Stenotrophomonas sp. 24(2023) TaxID=3068324 RepID=UPI0027E20389|nr:MFS transporter [Stenotrophomonas sp. 24(2023)]WMJ70836.1 MFS transporter [Stenotrophomonas sp. 24(2023)]